MTIETILKKKDRNIQKLAITELSSEEAMDFLMNTERYHDFELPEYFDFSEVLSFVRKKIKDKPYEVCLAESGASNFTDVNFDILLNKDGSYAVRPLVLCNPYLYYFLAREICGKKNWEQVKANFKECEVPRIKSCALPIVPAENESFHKSTTILNWWNSIEQRSIELSLDYKYMFVTDITNCYGSVNPQSIDWALSRKGTKKETDENHEIASNIILLLKEMQQGRNIGIPQGSTLFDLTGEIVLCYSDLLLHEALGKAKIVDGYEILRYRDDYRVFCNSKDTLEKISYILQQVLESLNFRMNSSKTKICNSIVTDSVKPDKLHLIYNTPIRNKNGYAFDSLQKHLLYILLFSREFPNSGQLRSLLSDFDKRVTEMLKPTVEINETLSLKVVSDGTLAFSGNELHEQKKSGWVRGNVRALCAIATQIALENVAVTHYALRTISLLTSGKHSLKLRSEIIPKVKNKLISIPNSTYSQLWLQNMTYKYDKEKALSPYEARLCKVVMGKNIDLWNNNWLKKELTKGFPQKSAVNKKRLDELTPVITFREKFLYNEIEIDNLSTTDELLDYFSQMQEEGKAD